VQVCGVTIEGHINGVTANIQILVVEGLMDVANELDKSISIKFGLCNYAIMLSETTKEAAKIG
jgi:hypothetical protein